MADLLTALELAKRLRVTRNTIYNWISRGWIPVLRIGQRKVLFDPEAVEAALKQKQ